MHRLPLLLLLISTAAVWAAFGEAAHAQILRRGFRRCMSPQHRFSTNSLSVKPVGAAVPLAENPKSHEQELRKMVAILPNYTRCVIVCRQPAIIDAEEIEKLEAPGRARKESIENLDRDPGMAFGHYLQALAGVGLANRAPDDLSEFFTKGQIRLIVGGRANYYLPTLGPAPVTQSDSVNICVYERPFSETWRKITQKRSQHPMSVLHREGDVEFFQDGENCVAFAPPNVVIFGDEYSYFHDVVKNAAGNGQSPPTARSFIDLVDPSGKLSLV